MKWLEKYFEAPWIAIESLNLVPHSHSHTHIHAHRICTYRTTHFAHAKHVMMFNWFVYAMCSGLKLFWQKFWNEKNATSKQTTAVKTETCFVFHATYYATIIIISNFSLLIIRYTRILNYTSPFRTKSFTLIVYLCIRNVYCVLCTCFDLIFACTHTKITFWYSL